VQPTLAIAPPRDALLSTDVECLKWQAYLALRGLHHIALRWDISPEGALDARLPILLLPDAPLLPPRSIPAWADARLDHTPDPLDGYRDQPARDESHAWIALLEGVVHAALVRPCHPPPSSLTPLQPAGRHRAPDTALSPPPPPSTGFASPFPPFGAHIDLSAVHARYAEAIAALSDRLATDTWFLASR
jgi:metaxin